MPGHRYPTYPTSYPTNRKQSALRYEQQAPIDGPLAGTIMQPPSERHLPPAGGGMGGTSVGKLPSLDTRAPDLPAIDEGRVLAKHAPLPEMKKLPVGADVGGADGAGASERGGGGPGVDGNVSARTYFREQRERMLMRGKEVRHYESAEIAFLASCRLRNHFTRALAEAEAEATKKKTQKGKKTKTPEGGSAGSEGAGVEEAALAPRRDLQYKWLEAALDGRCVEGRISDER